MAAATKREGGAERSLHSKYEILSRYLEMVLALMLNSLALPTDPSQKMDGVGVTQIPPERLENVLLGLTNFVLGV